MRVGSWTVTRLGQGRTVLVLVAACGSIMASCGGGDSKTKDGTGPTQTARAAAVSLQGAMDTSSRAIDTVRGSRDSLERLRATLAPAIAQTTDVVGVLTPKAGSAGAESKLLAAARQQRTFLQFAVESTQARTRRAANSALERAREAGRRASTAYSGVAQTVEGLGGLLPASTTFNTGRLRDAVSRVHRRRSTSPRRSSTGRGTETAPSASSSCGDGLSVNSVTTCPFARNVRAEYENSGGASVIEVYSPVTGQTYRMTCSGALPTVCRGGNGAVVSIR